jgi:hypothetical protein
MSKQEKPQPVGEAPCTVAGCAQVLQVFKYRERSGRGSMFKGKFYARCPDHGRVIDAAAPASQEHILSKGKIWAVDQRPEPAAPAPKQAPEPVKLTPPAPAQPAPLPVQPTPPPREPPLLRLWLRGWNLWDWWPGSKTQDS